jgi:hypothetical protein
MRPALLKASARDINNGGVSPSPAFVQEAMKRVAKNGLPA